MSNYLSDERNGIRKLINAKLAFDRKIVLNAVNDLDDVSPTQKLAIMEWVTNKNLLPKTSMIQEIQKEQMVEDASKPFIKALDNRDNAKIKRVENQQLALQDNSQDKQIQTIIKNIDTLLTHSIAKQTNKGILSLLENIGKIYQTLTDYNLYQHLSPNELAKLYTINKSILNKSFFKNKTNIKQLQPPYRDVYNFISNYIKTTPDNVKKLSETLLDSFKKPVLNAPELSLQEIDNQIKSSKKLSKTTANNILKNLIYKYNNLAYDDKGCLYELYITSIIFDKKIKHLPGVNKDDLTFFENSKNALDMFLKNYHTETSIGDDITPSSPLPSTSSASQKGSGIQKLFNKLKKLHS